MSERLERLDEMILEYQDENIVIDDAWIGELMELLAPTFARISLILVEHKPGATITESVAQRTAIRFWEEFRERKIYLVGKRQLYKLIWMKTLNVIRNLVKSETNAAERIMRGIENGKVVPSGWSDETASTNLIALETFLQLHKLVEGLPENRAEVVRLSFFQSVTGKEIARILDLSPPRISQILNDAMQQLAEMCINSGIDQGTISAIRNHAVNVDDEQAG